MRVLRKLKENPLLRAMVFSLALHGGLACFFIPPSLKLPERPGHPVEVVWVTKENHPPSLKPKMASTQKKKKIVLSKTSAPCVKKTSLPPPLFSSHERKRDEGGRQTPPKTPPSHGPKRKAHKPLPSYPWICRKRHQEGVVALKVKIDKEGRVIEANLHKSSGHTRLDEVALEALKAWVFAEDSCAKTLSIAFHLRG